jgi:hypothetical protein
MPRSRKAAGPKPQPRLLSEDILERWIALRRRIYGHYPSKADCGVWDYDESGKLVRLHDENWDAIDKCIRDGRRGLEALKGMTLATYKTKHGYTAEAEAQRTGVKSAHPRNKPLLTHSRS